MQLSELIAEVYTITGRPDLVAETASAVRKATLKMHAIDFFYRDLQEIVVGFPTTDYKQQYDLGANLQDYRAIKYIRQWNATHIGTEKFLERVEPDVVLDSCGLEGTDIWYVAGNMLNMKCLATFSNVVIGYYKHPNITTNLYSSWIAVEQPFAIIEEAAVNIFQMIGHAEMKTTYERMSAANILLLRQNYLDPQAR